MGVRKRFTGVEIVTGDLEEQIRRAPVRNEIGTVDLVWSS